MTLTCKIQDRFANARANVVIHDNEAPEWEARLASALIERWGLVAADVDGEDSSGRAKMRRLSPEELVAGACDTAALAVAEFRKRGWVLSLPSLEEMDAAVKSD